MGLNRYRILVIIRVILLLINLIAISVLSVQLKWFFSTAILFAVLIVQIIDLFHLTFKIKNDLDNLIRSFEQKDFSSKALTIDYKPKFKESLDSLNRIKLLLENYSIEQEVQFNFLKILIENVPSGIIVLKEGVIYLTNKSAKEILQLNELNSLIILKTNYPDFHRLITESDQITSELISLSKDNSTIQLSFSINQFMLLKEKAKIINFQNIKTALEQNELLAWNKLIRTMTHEIMNSVTPLISLSEAGYAISSEKNKPKKIENLHQKNIDHIFKSFKSIHNKGIWLKEFIENYRKLIRIPQPKLAVFNLNGFIIDLLNSMNDVFNKENIHIINQVEYTDLNADKNLIELVVLNLLKNSVYSLRNTSDKKIELLSKITDDTVNVHIIDNGEGISSKIIDQIFVPFFSTKEGGSGIGLTVAKQIMQMHQGKIAVKSDKTNTSFILIFKK